MKLFFYRKFIRFVIKHFTIVINNTIQMNGGQYIEHMNNYQGKEDEKCQIVSIRQIFFCQTIV